MAGCCVTYLFFSYASATIIYLILGIFASSGNLALLIEHYQYVNNDELTEVERKSVRKRTSLQFYFAFTLSLLTSLTLYILCMGEKKDKSKIDQSLSLDMKNKPYQPIILNVPQKNIMNDGNDFQRNINDNGNDFIPRNSSDNEIIQSINTISGKDVLGMGENEI